MRLNLGSGNHPVKGYKNIDIDLSLKPDECYDISRGIREKDNSVDKILISHTLMYLRPSGVKHVLRECLRVLKENGVIRITEDNRHLKRRNKEQQHQYGAGVLFDIIEMIEMLREVGFVNIRESKPFKATKHHLKLSKTYPLASGLASVYHIKAKKITRTGLTVFLGLDDFCETNMQMDLLWKLRSYFDDFKINLFAVPSQSLRHEWLHYISSLKWINLCIHGYNHTHFEELDEIVLKTITDKKIGYFKKIYKAPFWELSDDMEMRLKRLGFNIITTEIMNWEISSSIPNHDVLHAFGHIYPNDYKSKEGNAGSSLYHYFDNIKKLPKGTKFRLYDEPNNSAS